MFELLLTVLVAVMDVVCLVWLLQEVRKNFRDRPAPVRDANRLMAREMATDEYGDVDPTLERKYYHELCNIELPPYRRSPRF